jgi:hypothetical protein
MKKIFFFTLTLFGLSTACFSQTYIRTVASKPQQAPPAISGTVNAGDAVEIIMDWLNLYAAINCSNKLGESIKPLISKVQEKFKDKLKGKTAEFLVIIDAQNCKALGIVEKTQTIRIKDGQCSVDDIKLEAPALVYNPETTGFFSINIRF